MMKMISLSLLFILCLTACTPRIGVGIGGVVASGDGLTATQIHADSQTGLHGSVTVGTAIRL